MSSRFAVLGSNSFSGSHMVGKLLGEGHRVLGLSRSAELTSPFRPYLPPEGRSSWTFRQVDVRDAITMAAELKRFDPEYVINYAAQSMVAQSWTHPEHWYQTNVVALASVVRIIEDLPSLVRYVHVTTPEVYGSTGGWITEATQFNPSTPYAISRAAGDQHVLAVHRERGLPVALTRAANVYGPGQPLYRIVPRALVSARLGRQLRLDGGGRSTRAFVHIEDVSRATLDIALDGQSGATYHISTNEVVSIRGLVEMVCELTDVGFDELAIPAPERPGKDDTYMLDSTRLRSEFSWEPKFDLAAGLKDTLTWVDANIEALAIAPDAYVHKE